MTHGVGAIGHGGGGHLGGGFNFNAFHHQHINTVATYHHNQRRHSGQSSDGGSGCGCGFFVSLASLIGALFCITSMKRRARIVLVNIQYEPVHEKTNTLGL